VVGSGVADLEDEVERALSALLRGVEVELELPVAAPTMKTGSERGATVRRLLLWPREEEEVELEEEDEDEDEKRDVTERVFMSLLPGRLLVATAGADDGALRLLDKGWLSAGPPRVNMLCVYVCICREEKREESGLKVLSISTTAGDGQ